MKSKNLKVRAGMWLLFWALAGLAACTSKGEDRSKIIEREKTTAAFTELETESWLPIELVDSPGEQKVVVYASKSVQDKVKIEEDGNLLKIKMKEAKNLKSDGSKIVIYHHGLNRFTSNSVGTIKTINPIKTDSLELNINAVGKSEIALNAKFVRANLESVGENKFTGSVEEFRINNKSIGKLDAYGLDAKVLMIHNTAVGEALVKADSLIYIRSSAIGTLHYKGNAKVMELESEGLGKVKKDE